MKIDKKTLDMLSALPDDSFWQLICAVGNQSGFDLSSMKVKKGDLDRIRDTMGKLTDSDISRAMEILTTSKKQQK